MIPSATHKRKRNVNEQVVPCTTERRISRHSIDTTTTRTQNHHHLHHHPHHQHHATNTTPPAASPFADANYPIPHFERVYNAMRHPQSGLSLADRRWRLLTYSKCFVGSAAVAWLQAQLSCDAEEAVATGQRLMDAGIIHHVTHSEPFADAYYFYRFQEDDDTNILNMKRVWDTSIPTRDAVDVAKDLLTRLALLCEEYRKRILTSQPPPPPPPPPPPQPSPPPPPNQSNGNSGGGGGTAPSTPLLTDPTSKAPAPSPSPTFSAANLRAPFAANIGDEVDYSSLAKSERFRQYTLSAAELQRVQLVALNHDERLAFFVNVYNTLCLHAYVVYGPPNSVLRRYTFFRALSYRVAGLDLTLDDIEHGILRGNKRPPMIKFMQQLRPSDPKCQHVLTARDGRVHFVISAGTRSDPPIRILDGDNVQEELHYAAVEFLTLTVKVDTDRKSVTLPRIFYWYTEDFPTPVSNLLMWVAKYLPITISKALVTLAGDGNAGSVAPSVSYENFDWASAEARFNASVVRRKRRKLERERNRESEEQHEEKRNGNGKDNVQLHSNSVVDATLCIDGLFSSAPPPTIPIASSHQQIANTHVDVEPIIPTASTKITSTPQPQPDNVSAVSAPAKPSSSTAHPLTTSLRERTPPNTRDGEHSAFASSTPSHRDVS